MGMFDEIICEYPIPGGHAPTSYVERHPFQTKDLECQMDTYKITADGRLMVQDFDYEDRSDPNAKGWRAARGCMARINHRWVDYPDFTGSIHFYASNTVGGAPSDAGCVHFTENGEDDESVSYTALFVKSKLTHIEECSYERKPGLHVDWRGASKERLGQLWTERKAALVE